MAKRFEYAKNSILLVVGSGLAQVLPLAFQPYLRRTFSDVEFGLFAQYFSIVSIVALIAGLKYDASIMIPKSDRASQHILTGTVFINLCSSFLFLILLFLFGHHFLGAAGLSRKLENYFWLMPISVFLISTNLAINYWLTRKKFFRGIVINKVSRRAVEAGARVGFASRLVNGGMIYGGVIGDLINLVVSAFQYVKSGGKIKMYRKRQVLKELKEQIDFPKYSLLPNVLNVISARVPVFLFAILYGDAILGQFDGSQQMLAIPLGLISISLSQVLYQRIVDDVNNNRKIMRFIRNNFMFLAGLSIIGVIIVMPFGVEITTIYYGDNYELSGQITQILVISYGIKFIVSPLSMTLVGLKKLKLVAIWQATYFLMTICLFFIENMAIQDFVIIIVAIDVIAYFFYGALIYSAARKHDKKIEDLILSQKD